jgi:hypothetical protein
LRTREFWFVLSAPADSLGARASALDDHHRQIISQFVVAAESVQIREACGEELRGVRVAICREKFFEAFLSVFIARRIFRFG